MSKFNNKTQPNKTTNLAGGIAYKLSEKQELISYLWTSFLETSCYESKEERQEKITKAFEKTEDKLFLAKLALYSRNELGMRSISHLAASEIALSVKKTTLDKKLF